MEHNDSELPKTSPTHIKTDLRCHQERYLKTEYQGVGLELVTVDEEREVGKRLHAALQAFSNSAQVAVGERHDSAGRGQPTSSSKPLDAALNALRSLPQLTEPWATWLEATITAWALRVWPELAPRFQVVAVEQRLEFVFAGVRYKCFVDLILRDTTDGSLWVYDFKSFRRWDSRKWLKDPQVIVNYWAARENYPGEHVAGVIIQGFSKGTVRDGKLYHHLVYGYTKPEDPGITKAAYSYEYKRGFERFQTLGYPGGVEAWVRGAPDLIISEVLPRTQPIFVDDDYANRFLIERSIREQNISAVSRLVNTVGMGGEGVTEAYFRTFPTNPEECESDFHRCDMYDACHSAVVRRDPVASGIYQLRYTGAKR